MTKSPEKRGPVAISIKGGRNIRIEDNVSFDMPLLDATDVENLSLSGNKTFGHTEPTPTPTPRKTWYEHALFKPILAFVVGVAVLVIGTWILRAIGWN